MERRADSALAKVERLEADASDERDAFRALVGPTVARSLVAPDPPAGASLAEHRDVDGEGSARVYDVPGRELRHYHIEPAAATLGPAERETLAAVHEYLSAGRAGDGERERLGRNRPLAFAARTTVVVVVPPGNTGVGDVDGVRDERSAGWPHPGPTAPTSLNRAPESEVCCTRTSTTPRR